MTKTLKKVKTKTVISLQHVPLYGLSFNLKSYRFQYHISPKNINEKNFEKINVKIVINIQQCTPLIWRSSNFGAKFSQNNMNDKTFEKINVKIVTSIQQCTHVPNFSQFEELLFLKPNLSKKHFSVEYYDKRNLKIIYFNQK